MMSENSGKKQAGRFKPGQSGNPAGKPPGAKHKATMLSQAMFQGEAETIIRKVIQKAKKGNLQALKICVDRLCPPLKTQASTVRIDLPGTKNLVEIADAVLKAGLSGQIAPDLAAQMVAAVGTFAKVMEIAELKQRLAAIELALGQKERRQ